MKFDSALAHAQRGREGGREGGRVTKNTGVSAASVRGHGFGSDLVEGASIIMNGVVGFFCCCQYYVPGTVPGYRYCNPKLLE